MSSWYESLWCTAKPQQKPQPQSSQKTQIIDDDMIQSMDGPNQRKKLKQVNSQIPQQINSQSSSSSGFQQIIIEDGRTPQKSQQLIQNLPIQKSDQRIDDYEIDMYRTMNFDEDLNQNFANTYKHVKKSSFADKNLRQFSGLSNSNEKSFSDLSSNQNQMQDSFSNIGYDKRDKNLESFSMLSGDMANSKKPARVTKKDESDPDDEDEKNRCQQKNIDQVNEYLSVWGIERKPSSDIDKQKVSKANFEQRKNSQSFSELNADNFPAEQKPEQLQYIQMEWSMDGDTKPKSDLIDLSDLEKSVIAPSNKPISIKKNHNLQPNDAFSKSPIKPKTLLARQTQVEEPKIITQTINMGESIVMSPVIQKPFKKPQKQAIEKKAKQPNLSRFKIHSKDFVHFIQYGQTEDRLISQKLLQSITQTFLLQNIMLPIFNIKLMHDIEHQMEIERKQLKQNLFTFSIKLYFELLDKKYPQQMKKFFESQQSSKYSKSQVGVTIKKQENAAFLGNLYKKAFEYLKLNHYSKAQILKKTLESELAFVSQYKETWLQNWQDNDEDTEQFQEDKTLRTKNSEQLQNVKEKERYLLKKIAQLEVLISFEKSELYCEEKLTQKMEENIWKERKRKLIEDRNWFITYLFENCLI